VVWYAEFSHTTEFYFRLFYLSYAEFIHRKFCSRQNIGEIPMAIQQRSNKNLDVQCSFVKPMYGIIYKPQVVVHNTTTPKSKIVTIFIFLPLSIQKLTWNLEWSALALKSARNRILEPQTRGLPGIAIRNAVKGEICERIESIRCYKI